MEKIITRYIITGNHFFYIFFQKISYLFNENLIKFNVKFIFTLLSFTIFAPQHFTISIIFISIFNRNENFVCHLHQ